MPRSITTWYCNKCNEIFENESDAKDCEDNHYTIVKIIDEQYFPCRCAPMRIQVEVDTGGGYMKKVMYELIEEERR